MAKKSSKEDMPKVQDIGPEPQAQTPVEQQPQPQPQVTPQPQPQAVQSSGGSKNLKFIILGIILIAAGIGGYGYWNGMQIKNYVSKAEPMRNTSKEWGESLNKDAFSDMDFNDVSDLTKIKSTVEEEKSKYEKIKSESEKYLSELEKTKAPVKADELEKNLKEYFGITKDLADYGVYGTALIESATKMMNDMMSLSPLGLYGGESTSEAAVMKKLKSSIDDFVKEMEKIEAPTSLKDTHEEMIKSLKKLSDSLESGDISALTSMQNPFEEIDSGKFKTDIDQKKTKGQELEKKIDEQISSLKNITFSF